MNPNHWPQPNNFPFPVQVTKKSPDNETEMESSHASNFEEHKNPKNNIKKVVNDVANINFKLLDDDSIKQMAFRSIEEAHKFYVEYGKHKGFKAIITGTQYEDGMAKFRQMECNRGGTPRARKGDGKRKVVTKCRCLARLRVVRCEMDNLYYVTNFISHHNHELSTGETANGKKVKRETQESLSLCDADRALFLVEGLKSLDPEMFCKYEMGEDNSFDKFFLTDRFSREAYELFGDVLVITYKTNTRDLPVIILSGVDNHLKSIVFAIALLVCETLGSYVWLLRKFREAMGERVPVSVLTDQTPYIGAAIATVLPNAKHRLCNWELERNCMQNVNNQEFCGAFGGLLRENVSVKEFEEKWAKLVNDYGVADHPWILQTYAKKERWSEAFFRGHFMGLLRTVQKVELLNDFFTQGGKAGYTEFIEHYDCELGKARSSFLKNQEESERYEPQLKGLALYQLHKHASSLYTKEVFHLVQHEIFQEQGLVDAVDICSIKRGRRQFSYECFWYSSSRRERWSVEIDLDEGKFLCSCKMLESDGLPCRHLFGAFKRMFLYEIPSQCIRERWTTGIGIDLKSRIVCPDKRMRFISLYHLADEVFTLASESEAKTQKCIEMLRTFSKKLDEKQLADSHQDPVDDVEED